MNPGLSSAPALMFLPVVMRELRVGARGRTALWVRVGTTLFGVVLAGFALAFASGTSLRQTGGTLFFLVTAFAFGVAVLAGVFVTADCLSEEKRSGTLGFLFLTNLRGYDVVLGKFVARGLGPGYAMLAMLPVMAIAFVIGGVTPGEFARTALVLLNTLFLSLAVGIAVSAWAREAQAAVVGTVAILLGLGGLQMLGRLAPLLHLSANGLQWASPLCAFVYAMAGYYTAAPGNFWGSLIFTHVGAWVLLALASFKIQFAWQDQPAPPQVAPAEPTRAPRRRSRLDDAPPLPWLLRMAERSRVWLWALTGCWAAGVIGLMFLVGSQGFEVFWLPVFFVAKGLALLLKIVFTVVACRFFAEARRGGLLEMILSTPLTDREIIRSQWQHLRRWFVGPVGLFCAPLLLRTVIGWDEIGFNAGAAIIAVLTGFGSGAFLALNTLIDFFALGWVGMWFAVSMRKPGLAPGVTVLLVLILPAALFCVPSFLIDIFFIAWASRKLAPGFRRLVSEQFTKAPAPR